MTLSNLTLDGSNLHLFDLDELYDVANEVEVAIEHFRNKKVELEIYLGKLCHEIVKREKDGG